MNTPMTNEELIRYAVEEGFADAAVVNTEDIIFDPSFRPYCEENLCGQYGVNYTCPPACGTVEEMKARVLSYKRGLLLQTIWQISDFSDAAAIKHAKTAHNAAQLRLLKRLRASGCEGFPIGASGCALCSPCAYKENKPCNFPEFKYSCMSAYCIFVKKLADKAGISYDCGEGLLAFFGMYICD